METRRPSPLDKYGKLFVYILLALILLEVAALVAVYGICKVDLFPEVCRYDHLYLTVSILVTVLTLWPIGKSYHNRAMRNANRGVYAKPGKLDQAFQYTMQLVTRTVTESEPGLITGLDRFQNTGWWVTIPAQGGTTVWVDQYTFWQWLEKVEAMRQNGDRYPTARDRWERVIGKSLWLAYCTILEEVGVLQFTTDDPRSKRYQGAIPWSVVEQYAKMRPPTRK
jgi:hypothetical protein